MMTRKVRGIHPDFVEDEVIQSLPPMARYLFILLWTQADDAGRLRGAPWLLKGRLFPMDEEVGTEDVDKWLQLLHDTGRIRRYEIRGQHYVRITNWLKNQIIRRPVPSQLPPESDKEPQSATHCRTCVQNKSELSGKEPQNPVNCDMEDTSMDQEPDETQDSPQNGQVLGQSATRCRTNASRSAVVEERRVEESRSRGERENAREVSDQDQSLSPLSADSLSNSERFSYIRNQWPASRRGSEKKSLAAWHAALKKATTDEIELGAMAWVSYWRKGDNGAFAYEFANWLRDERWKQPPPTQPKGKGIEHEQRLVNILHDFLDEEGDDDAR